MNNIELQQNWEDDGLHEECGVFGMYDLDGNDIASSIYYGLFALQHRGQESCGIAVSDTFGPRKVDLLKGIAVGASMKVIEVEGANGGLNTNYEGKAQAAIDVLTKEGYDFAYIHVEAPDEMGHQGSVERKVKAIEYLDSRVIKPVKEGLEAAGEDFRMLVLPDHPTPICMRTHSSDSVPYLLYDSTDLQQHDWKYNEAEGESSGNYVACGHEIIDYLFGRKTC